MKREYSSRIFVGFLIWFTLFTFFCALGVIAQAADQRGFKVRLKAKNSKDAPVVEEVKLYSASYALVIGNDDYNQGWPRLSNGIADAQKVAEALENKGFEVTFKKDLTSTELKAAFEEFFIFKGDNPNARLFVWFAGHGHTIDGNGFLVPVDAPTPDDGPQFKYMALSMQRFGEFVRMAKSKHTYAVFDSCFAGTIFDTRRSLPPVAITRMVTFPVRQFLTSGDSDQEVSDDGRFCKLFIRAISGEEIADANQDGYLTGTELGNFISDRITNLTKAKQTPRYGKFLDEDFDRGDFVFLLPHEEIPPPPENAVLYVESTPSNAVIRIENINDRFYQGMPLPAGRYLIVVAADGHKQESQWVTLNSGEEKHLPIELKGIDLSPSGEPDQPSQPPPSPPQQKKSRTLPPISF